MEERLMDLKKRRLLPKVLHPKYPKMRMGFEDVDTSDEDIIEGKKKFQYSADDIYDTNMADESSETTDEEEYDSPETTDGEEEEKMKRYEDYPDFFWIRPEMPKREVRYKSLCKTRKFLITRSLTCIFEDPGDPETKGEVLAEAMLGWIKLHPKRRYVTRLMWWWFMDCTMRTFPGHELQTTLLKCLRVLHAEDARRKIMGLESIHTDDLLTLQEFIWQRTPFVLDKRLDIFAYMNMRSFYVRSYALGCLDAYDYRGLRHFFEPIKLCLEHGEAGDFSMLMVAESLKFCAERLCKRMIPGMMEEPSDGGTFTVIVDFQDIPEEPRGFSPEHWELWKLLLLEYIEGKNAGAAERALRPNTIRRLREAYAKMVEVEAAIYAENPQYPRTTLVSVPARQKGVYKFHPSPSWLEAARMVEEEGYALHHPNKRRADQGGRSFLPT